MFQRNGDNCFYCTHGKLLSCAMLPWLSWELFPRHLFPIGFQVRIGQKRNLPLIWEEDMKQRGEEGQKDSFAVRYSDGNPAVPGSSQYQYQQYQCPAHTFLCFKSSLSPPPQKLALLNNSSPALDPGRKPKEAAATQRQQLP